MPQSKEDLPSKRSCLRCHEHKVRCDRGNPCGRCLQVNAKCSFPGNKRAPRKLNRPPIATILAQLKELEEEVERLRARPDVNQNEPSSLQLDQRAGQYLHSEIQASDMQTLTNRSVMRDGESFGDQISEFQESPGQSLTGASSNNRVPGATTGHNPFSSTGVLGLNIESETEAIEGFKLNSLQIKALWDIYKMNVAPMIALLHKRSTETMIYDACTKPEPNLPPTWEVLVLAICFSAVLSTTQEQCLSIFSQDRGWCIRNTRLAVEQGLARADLINTQDTHILQAAVLFLLCLRWIDSRLAWAQAAIVVRVAQGQSVHRDGQFSGLSPFNIEMRRRLWWHICILDVLCSEDQGIDTQIRPEMFDTKIPTNIDIDDLSPDLPVLLPPRRGFTDITLCIMHNEIMYNVDWASINLNPETSQYHAPEQESVLYSLAARLEEQYLQEFDLQVPIQWLTAVIVRLCLSKARVVNLLNKSRTNKVSTAINDEIFDVAVEIIQFARLIQNNEATAQWSWICKSYKQRHAVSFILSELCNRPITPETDQAWEIVTEMYNQWQQEANDNDAEAQIELSGLMERAASIRTRKLDSLRTPREHSTLLPMPRSIIYERVPSSTSAIDQIVGPSIASDPVAINHILGQGSQVSFSSMDWLTGPWL